MPIIQAPQGPGLSDRIFQILLQKQELELRREDQKLRQADQKLRDTQAAIEQGAQQAALQQLLSGAMGGDAFATQFIGQNPALSGAMDNGLSPEELADPRLLGATAGLQDARNAFDTRVLGEFRQRLASATPAQAAELAAAAPPQALAAEDVRGSLARLRDEQERLTRNTAILSRVPEDRREAASLMLEWDDATDTQRAALFPELFATGVDPATVTRIIAGSIASQLPIGDIRQAFGVRDPLPGLPDDFRFPTTASNLATERRQIVGMHAASLAYHNNIINEIERQEGGISLPAQVHRELMVSSAMSGGLLGSAAAVGDIVANWFTGLTGRQQELVAAQFNWANSYRYMVSGQQTSDREFGIILKTTQANVGDTPETIAQKRAFRETMLNASQALARGEITGIQSVQQLQEASQGLTALPAEDRAALAGVLTEIGQDAATQQSNGGTPDTPLIPDTLTGDPATDLGWFNQLIGGLGGGN